MSARVLNPAMITEMSRVMVASGAAATTTNNSGRVAPSRAALARVRRDLFGPVDHAAARALAEHELRAQARLDAERWGFDFRLEVPLPKKGSRFDWEVVTTQDVVPEPYALRGMHYLGTPPTPPPPPKKQSPSSATGRLLAGKLTPLDTRTTMMTTTTTTTPTTPTTSPSLETGATTTPNTKQLQQVIERTPPQQEARVPAIGQTTPDVVPGLAELSFRSAERPGKPAASAFRAHSTVVTTAKKQSSITV